MNRNIALLSILLTLGASASQSEARQVSRTHTSRQVIIKKNANTQTSFKKRCAQVGALALFTWLVSCAVRTPVIA